MSDDSVLIFTVDQVSTSFSDEVRRGLESSFNKSVSHAAEITVATLQENMRRFLNNLDSIISTSPSDIGGLVLDEIEIQAQIDGKGNIGFAGVGMELAAQYGIKFVLRKKS